MAASTPWRTRAFPELVHLVGKVLLPDGAAQHHELIAADAVSFAGEDFVQGVGGAADEGIPGLVAEAVVAVLETVQVHVNAADLPQRRFLPAAQVLHVAVAVEKARQHIDITELIQPLLRLFLLQTVGHEELDGGQQRGVPHMLLGVVYPQKTGHDMVLQQRHRQQRMNVLGVPARHR